MTITDAPAAWQQRDARLALGLGISVTVLAAGVTLLALPFALTSGPECTSRVYCSDVPVAFMTTMVGGGLLSVGGVVSTAIFADGLARHRRARPDRVGARLRVRPGGLALRF
ncbi:MAG: hypothetical protein H6713_19905 [Myxococcales bacterium]|nr:hypothetical protein [Myxococcales bacterium]